MSFRERGRIRKRQFVGDARVGKRGVYTPHPGAKLARIESSGLVYLVYNAVSKTPSSSPGLGFGKGIEELRQEHDRSEASIARWIVSRADEKLSRIVVDTVSQDE